MLFHFLQLCIPRPKASSHAPEAFLDYIQAAALFIRFLTFYSCLTKMNINLIDTQPVEINNEKQFTFVHNMNKLFRSARL